MISRFAPSPTGRLHIGHAWSALFAAAHGTMILRIEDIDPARCHPEFIDDIIEDMRWLGIAFPYPVRRQSDNFDDYRTALQKLDGLGLLYPCFCTRKDIQDSGAAPHGPEGMIYPGTCRHLSESQRQEKIETGLSYALRIDMQKALQRIGKPLIWTDIYKGAQTATAEILGDVVLARKDTPASYHLCVTLDDHLQGVTLVTRGEDLFYASHLHRVLQQLLDLDVPQWAHHPLLRDAEGKRFAKRNDSVTLQSLHKAGRTPDDIVAMIHDALPEDGPWRALLKNDR